MNYLKEEDKASIRSLGRSASMLSRNNDSNQPVNKLPMASRSGTGITNSIGVGLRYISPDTHSGALSGAYAKTLKSSIPTGEGTVASGAINDAKKSVHDYNAQNLSMQLHGNDFADLKYFEPGEHLPTGVTAPRPPKLNSSNLHSNTFDHSR